MSLVSEGYPVLLFRQRDETWDALGELAENFTGKGAAVFVAQEGSGGKGHLPVEGGIAPLCQLPVMVQSFYLMVESIALECGLDPDNPRHLKKVTETL